MKERGRGGGGAKRRYSSPPPLLLLSDILEWWNCIVPVVLMTTNTMDLLLRRPCKTTIGLMFLKVPVTYGEEHICKEITFFF